jgi:flagellar biosynthesis protein FlhF
MITRNFKAKDMKQAMRDIGRELGSEAVILSNTKVGNGVEVLATLDYDADMFRKQITNPNDRYNDNHLSAKNSDSKVNKIIPAKIATISNADYIAPVDSTLVDIQSEISDLKNLMESQLSGSAWGDEMRRNPLRAKLTRNLIELGLTPSLSKSIANKIPGDINIKEAWERAVKILIDEVSVVDNRVLETSRIVTLIGPTGVGKTTTIAKLAARAVLQHGKENIALITTDCYRIGAQEQLRTYGRILNIPVYTVKNEKELAETMALVKKKDLVLIDSAGMSHRDERLESQLAMLGNISSKKRKTFLVMSAATQYESLNETIRNYSKNIDGCVLTKLDEAVNLGAVISSVVENKLPIAYVSDGQRVPEDIENIKPEYIVNRCISLMHEMGGLEESLEKLLWSRSVNANV